jgi:hypothetical protein
MNQMRIIFLFLITATFIFASSIANAAGTGTTIGVRLVGTDQAYPGTALFDAYGVVGPDSLCWDFDMLDINTGDSIGDVTDCAAIIDIVDTEQGDRYKVLGTTFFYFPGGTFVSRVYTSVMPVTHGSPNFTHITGAAPVEGTDNVLYGDRKFKSATGTVRFSGTGNLSTFFVDGVISIDCLFTLDISTGSN